MSDGLGLPEPQGVIGKFVDETAKRAPLFASGAWVPQVLGSAITEAAYSPEGKEAPAALMGGAFAGAGKAVGETLPHLMNAGRWINRRIGAPWRNIEKSAGYAGINTLGEDNIPTIVRELRNRANVAQTPNLNFTSGQKAAVPANSPELAHLQKMAAERHPSLYSTAPEGIQGQQNNALLEHLRRNVAGQPGELENLVLARRTQTKPLYDAAENVVEEVPQELIDIFERQDARTALGHARRIASNKGQPFDVEGTPAQPSGTLDASGNPIMTPAVPGQISGRDAQIIDQAFGDAIYSAKASNSGVNLADSIKTLRGDFRSVTDDLIPELGDANALYRDLSIPVNERIAGQEIMGQSVDDLTGMIQPTAFAHASTKPDLLSDIRPQGQVAMREMREDLGRMTQADDFMNQGGWLGRRNNSPDAIPPTGMFNPWIAAARSVANRVIGAGSDKSLNRLTSVMHDPETFANLLEHASAAERSSLMRAFAESLRGNRVFAPISGMGTTAFINQEE